MERITTCKRCLVLRLVSCVFSVATIGDCVSGPIREPACAAESPSYIRAGELPQDIDRALWWLPDSTETILVSRGNVPRAELRRGSPGEGMGGAPFLPSPQGYCYPKQDYPPEDLVAMHCIEPLAYYRRIYPPDVRHRLINAFYSPRSATLFMKALCWDRDGTRQTCDIVMFCDNRASRLVGALAASGSVVQTTGGVEIGEVDLNQEPSAVPDIRGGQRQEPPKADLRWVAALRPDVYVCSTSLDLLKVIIARSAQRAATRALPASLPEWQYVNPAQPTWGVRHYRTATADKRALSMLQWDPEAVGLVFFGGNDPAPYFALRYLSNSESGGTRILRMQCEWWGIPVESELRHQLPPWRPKGNKCFESRMRINVPRDQAQGSPFTDLPIDVTWFFSMSSMYLPWLGFPSPAAGVPAVMMQR